MLTQHEYIYIYIYLCHLSLMVQGLVGYGELCQIIQCCAWKQRQSITAGTDLYIHFSSVSELEVRALTSQTIVGSLAYVDP